MIHVSLGVAFAVVAGWLALDLIFEGVLRPKWSKWRNRPPESCKTDWESWNKTLIELPIFVLVLWWISAPPT